jgi:hypothetical protein
MSLKSVLTHLALWLVIFACWLVATRHFHPTLLIAVLATGVFVAASASAVYISRRIASESSRLRYIILLAVVVILLDLVAVITIQLIYDMLWGPDQNRFGFWFNIASDGFIIVLHLVGAAMARHVMRRWRRQRGGLREGAVLR